MVYRGGSGRPKANFGYSSPEAKSRNHGDCGAGNANRGTAIEQIAGRKQCRVNEKAAQKQSEERGGDVAAAFSAAGIHRTTPARGRRADLVIEGLQHGSVGGRREQRRGQPS